MFYLAADIALYYHSQDLELLIIQTDLRITFLQRYQSPCLIAMCRPFLEELYLRLVQI